MPDHLAAKHAVLASGEGTFLSAAPEKCRADECPSRDLLRRHIRNAHAPPSADDPQGTAKPPDRSPHACMNCVKNKTKCDKDMPCTRCVQRGWTCEPRPSRRSQKHPKATAEQDTKPDRKQSPSTAEPMVDEQGPTFNDSAPQHQDAAVQTPSPPATNLFSLDHLPTTSTVPAPDPKAFFDHIHLSQPLPLPSDIPDVHQLYFDNHDSDFGWLDDGMMPGLTMDGESIETSPEPPNSTRMFYPPPEMTADCGSPSQPVLTGVPPAMQPVSNYVGAFEVSLDAFKGTMQAHHDRQYNSDVDMTTVARSGVSEPALGESQPYAVETFTADARDRLIMVVQRVLHLGSQRLGREVHNYLQLPPPNVLESLLHSFMQNDQAYFDLIPGRFLETSVLVQSGDYGTLPGLFLLLALSKGAMCSGTADGCELADALLDSCLAALSDLTVRTSHWQGGFKAFHSLLLLQELAAWSSNSNTQKIGRSLWMKGIKMLHEEELIEYRPLQLGPSVEQEASFHLWRDREYQSRLLHAWLVTDLEMSLFNDSLPKVSAKDIRAALPESPLLWHARSVDEWLAEYRRMFADDTARTQLHTESFSEAVRKFIHEGGDSLLQENICPTKLLGVLLHSLHSLSSHLHHSFDYMFPTSDHGSYSVFTASRALSGEAQVLLERWLKLYNTLKATSHHDASHTKYLIMYHLIWLNQLTSVPRIEHMLWQGQSNSAATSSWFRLRWEGDLPRILFHVGQAIKLIKDLPAGERPSWWAAAMYRIILIAYAGSLAYCAMPRPSPSAASDDGSRRPTKIVAVDKTLMDDSVPQAYLDELKDCVPAVTCKDGRMLTLDTPTNVVDHCLHVWSEMEPEPHASKWLLAKLNRLREL